MPFACGKKLPRRRQMLPTAMGLQSNLTYERKLPEMRPHHPCET